ncbi:hypothetical protein NL676_007915 [Syzygium grande]|nr:hypothetical protein NL676_007915 [Syzygium grande]
MESGDQGVDFMRHLRCGGQLCEAGKDGGCGPMEGASGDVFSKGESKRSGQLLKEFELDVDGESLVSVLMRVDEARSSFISSIVESF